MKYRNGWIKPINRDEAARALDQLTELFEDHVSGGEHIARVDYPTAVELLKAVREHMFDCCDETDTCDCGAWYER